MEWIEVAARTVDEAKELALDRLGVTDEELEFEVIDEPRSGLLGRLSRSEARIRARVKPVSREKPGDRRQRRKRSNERSGERSGSRSGGSKAKSSPAKKPASTGEDEATPSTSTRSSSSRRRSRSRSGGGGSSANTRQQTESTEADDVNESALPIEEQASAAARFTEELVAGFGLTARVDAAVVDDDIEVNVEGEGLGVLVGPRGVTLQAIEELVRAIVQHVAGGHSARLHVDVAGYRERRREALGEFARKVAGEVVETGEERSLEPMNAPDRKVVHDALSDFDGVATGSEGEDPRRRVVIRPA